jgi:hypothetical protein
MSYMRIKLRGPSWKSRRREPYSGTLAGTVYIDNPGGKWVTFTEMTQEKRKDFLTNCKQFGTLKPKIINILSKAEDTLLKRLVNLWRGIEDCIVLSSPEIIIRKKTRPFLLKLWKWVISTGSQNVDTVTMAWKSLTKQLEFIGSGCEGEPPPIVKEIPGIYQNKLGPNWFKTFPWLEFALGKFPKDKIFIEKLSLMCNHRGLPAPSITKDVINEEFLRLRNRLTRLHPLPNEDVLELFEEISKTLGKKDRNGSSRDPGSFSHLSVSIAGSFGAIRKDGGRLREISLSFRASYIDKAQNQDLSSETWFGGHYKCVRGVPKWKTMCRPEPITEDFEFSQVYDDAFATNALDFALTESHVGIDSQLGYQLLQWSIETGIEDGYLIGSPFKDGNGLKVNPLKPPPVFTGLIGEPGCKKRNITIAKAWMTVLLAPLGHILVGLMSESEYSKTGLKADNMAQVIVGHAYSHHLQYLNLRLVVY